MNLWDYFMWAPEPTKSQTDTLDCVLFFCYEPAAGGGRSGSYQGVLVGMSSYCLEKCRLKIDITCFWMRISFSFPTNMCKYELYCFQVTFFPLEHRGFISEASWGEFLLTFMLWKRALLPIFKVMWRYCATSVRLKNINTSMNETVITGE